MPPSPNPLFKFNREGYSVNVTSIADAGESRLPLVLYVMRTRLCTVSRREIIDLFTNLIGTCILLLLASSPSHLRVSLLGDIQTCEELYEAGRRYYSLTFTTQDAAK